MGYAFISYSSKNQMTADAFRELFRKNNIDTWMAPYDIPVGSTYVEKIPKAIRGCSCLVLLLSNNSQNSYFVIREIEFAISIGKTIFPIRIDDVTLDDAYRFLIGIDQIKAINKIDENSDTVKQIIESVCVCTGYTAVQAEEQSENNVVYDTAASEKETEIVMEDGTVFCGNFSEGKPTGRGKKMFTSGVVYEGFFTEGLLNGAGKCTWPDGGVYEGDFANDWRTGCGRMTWPDGRVYEGDFEKGSCTGKCRMTWPDGNVYEGDFADGKMEGKGRFIFADGTVQEGYFKDGKFLGTGR